MLKRVSIVIGAVAIAVLLISGIVQRARRVGVNQGYEPDQPIAYSHKIHAGDHKIPCLYCHFGAEKGRHAGIPPAGVCMNCHSMVKTDSPEVAKIREAIEKNQPIQWVKVHHLPDFVYFNHSQHVVVAGLACQECHGPIETMMRVRQESPLTMGWCIDCHRKKGIVPPGEHPNARELKDRDQAIGGTDCTKCHY